jgi:glycosyltransferase involved in cell wall biosynthesis
VTCSILVLTRYGYNGPSSRLRHHLFSPALEKAGFRVTIAPFLPDDYLDLLYAGAGLGVGRLLATYGRRLRWLTKAGRFDLVWIEKEALPWLPAALESALLARSRVVSDFDDAWYLRYAENPNPLIRATMSRKLENVVGRAVLVIAGNAELAAWARASGAPRVIELPTPVDTDHYPVLPPPAGPFTIGWIGTPHSSTYLALVAEALARLQTTRGARIVVIGAGENLSLPGVSVEHRRWSEASEAAELARCHVGIMPLANGPWERGKCGYKLIQYMAAGRATVASPVGSNKSIVAHNETGFLADGTEQWVEALSALADNRDLTTKFGLAGRKRVEQHYSLRVAAPTLVEAMRQVTAVDKASARQPDRLLRSEADRRTSLKL